MKPFTIILLILFLMLLIAACIAVHRVMQKVENFSMNVFGTKSIQEGLRRQKKELSVQPKSVSGMNAIFEPLIREDFPDFNWREFQTKAERQLANALYSITEGNIGRLKDATDEFKNDVLARIENNEASGIREVYKEVKVHKTVISDYEKKDGMCMITLQSAVGHIHYREDMNGKFLDGDKEYAEQTKYDIRLMYIQDADLVGGLSVYGMTCPNCGAPIRNLGDSHCEYCKADVAVIQTKAWNIHSFYESTKQKF